MGSVLHPVGPQAPGVYWVRRALVLLVLLAVVSLVVWALWPKPAAITAVPAPTTTQTAASAESPASTPAATPSPSPTPTGPVACEPGATKLAISGYKRVKAGAKQVFSLSATNRGEAACILAVKPATTELTVTSGKDRIWSTADCDAWLPSKTVTLKPGAVHEFSITWPTKRSQKECKTSKDAVRPGTYVGTASYRESSTARQVMLITK